MVSANSAIAHYDVVFAIQITGSSNHGTLNALCIKVDYNIAGVRFYCEYLTVGS